MKLYFLNTIRKYCKNESTINGRAKKKSYPTDVTAMKEAADKSFEKLIRSMNRVNVRTVNEKSILVNLANNLLLTAMFMETIGFVSVLFSLGNVNKVEMNSSEIRDEWLHKRKRRTLIFEI